MPRPDVNDLTNSQYAIRDSDVYTVEAMNEMARANIARAEKIREMEAMLSQLKETSCWRPIESAPRDGTPVLLCGGRDDCAGYIGAEENHRLIQAPARAVWDGVCWVMGFGENGWAILAYENPTHWMPLPEPPTKE